MNVGIAYPMFFEAFRKYYPNLENVEDYRNVRKYDLIIFSGGEDINPRIYGEQNLYSSYSDVRDEIELSILKECLNREKKVLGVCRGHQLINAYLGGRLVQDILFSGYKNHGSRHPLETLNSSMTEFILQGGMVNSLHHQGVTSPSSRLNIGAVYNRIIEATESANIYSVQFHPEFMDEKFGTRFFDTVNLWVRDRNELIRLIKEKNSGKKDINTKNKYEFAYTTPVETLENPVFTATTWNDEHFDEIRNRIEELRRQRAVPRELGDEE